MPRRYCVLGLGRTGLSTARWLLEHKEEADSVFVFPGKSSSETDITGELSKLGAEVVLGTDDVASVANNDSEFFDVTVVSPGIAPSSRFFKTARLSSKEVIGEPEFAWRKSPDKWIGITGTNGKTTTTSLMTYLLESNGWSAQSVGNIGTPCIERLDSRPSGSWFVAELSSFQLETSSRMKPVTACLLNITPDHIEWHGTLEDYAAAKEKIFQNFACGDLAVVSEEDAFCRAICERLEKRGVRVCHLNVSSEPQSVNAAFVRNGVLIVRNDGMETGIIDSADMSLKGEHNIQNALAVSAMAVELGISAYVIAAALSSFSPLEHRIEPCGELDGVRFVNDSKATNTDSVEKALTAFEDGKIVLLLGGHDKGTSLATLSNEIVHRCKAAICYGEASERMYEALVYAKNENASNTKILEAEHMTDAFYKAVGIATDGDTVLLSPACSSFDEFSGFEERGRVFKEIVREYIGR